jgi:hypothetical protein
MIKKKKKDLNQINNDDNIFDKFSNILNIYNKMTDNNLDNNKEKNKYITMEKYRYF